jgi:hypothetical protein
MREVRKADPAARRHAVLTVVLGALVGAFLIVGFDWYGNSVRDWVRAQPSDMPRRLRLLFLLGASLLSAPLLVFAVHFWSLGARVLRARQFPPPGYRVIRDTPVIGGRGALVRGRAFKILGVGLGVTSVLLWLQIWRLARMLGGGA